MKKLPLFCLAALLLGGSLSSAQSPTPNAYDVLSRVLTPIASVFSPEAARHALSLTLVLEEMTGLPPELAGARVELLLEPPDHLLLRGLYAGTPVTLCRAGNAVWITPNTPPFNALANPPGEPPHKHKKKKQGGGGLEPMVLPFSPQQLALLPILFQVKEAEPEQGLRTLEVRLMPELAHSLGVEEWSVRLSLNAAEQLARLRILGPGWTLAARVERLDYAAQLPAATWQPSGDAVQLDAPKVEQWMQELSRQVDAHRP